MRTLTSGVRRLLRAKAHHLNPVVSIGHHGLTPAVLNEIDVNLRAHELIKVRVFGDDRDERERLLAQICDGLDAAPVQQLGKTLTVWRPAPKPAPADKKTRAKPRGSPSTSKPKPKSEAAPPRARPSLDAKRGRPAASPGKAKIVESRRRRVPRQRRRARP
jgi:putative YhbY family RNA-binding protein